mmetsp:Transcript_47401/g.53014  ORF Transcript_47401/g.53014 Transcript_47401/m.53014 type:complete len:134 (+) Transcript_47401:174-575(+)
MIMRMMIRMMMSRKRIRILLLLVLCRHSKKAATGQSTQEEEEEEEKGEEKDLNLPGRRNTLVRMGTTTSLFLTIMMAATVPTPALALRNKNEALCGTGFFEHIYVYKCTSIGDIEDEGTSKKLGQVEINVQIT